MRFVELATVSEHVAAPPNGARRRRCSPACCGRCPSRKRRRRRVAHRSAPSRTHRGRVVGAEQARPGDADEPSLEVLEIDRWLSDLAAALGAWLDRSAARAAARRVRPGDRARAAAAVGCARWRVAPGGARGRDGRGDRRGAGVPVAEVRRGHMFAGDLGETAAPGVTGGVGALARSRSAGSGGRADARLARGRVAEALAETGEASVEWKLDGARVQAHRSGGEVRLFTRNLNDITDRLPGVVVARRRAARRRPRARWRSAGLDEDGGPRRLPGHDGRLRRRSGSGTGGGLRRLLLRRASTPAAAALSTSRSRPPRRARPARAGAVPPAVDRHRRRRRGRGVHGRRRSPWAEGVMVKDLDSAVRRRAPRRRRGARSSRCTPSTSSSWPSSGATAGAGAGCPTSTSVPAATTGFVMVGKTFKGLTDELLRWQTERFRRSPSPPTRGRHTSCTSARAGGRDRPRRRPALHPLSRRRRPAVRPRRRYRPDKAAADADRIESLQALV